MTASHAAPLIPFTRLLTAPSPSASASCTPSAVPLAEIDDDETKALLGAHVHQTLATRPHPTLTRRQHDALVLCIGRKPLRLVVYSIPPDPSFTVRAILGDLNDANDQGMPVRDFLERVDATMVKMEDVEGRTSFMTAQAIMNGTRDRSLSSLRARLRVVDFEKWLDFLRRQSSISSHPSRGLGQELDGALMTASPQRAPALSPSRLLRRLFHPIFHLTIPSTASGLDERNSRSLQEVDMIRRMLILLKAAAVISLASELAPPKFDVLRVSLEQGPLHSARISTEPRVRQQAIIVHVMCGPQDCERPDPFIVILNDENMQTSFMVARAVMAHERVQPLSCMRARLRAVPAGPSVARAHVAPRTRTLPALGRRRHSTRVSESWAFTGSGWLHHSHKRAASMSILTSHESPTCSAITGSRLGKRWIPCHPNDAASSSLHKAAVEDDSARVHAPSSGLPSPRSSAHSVSLRSTPLSSEATSAANRTDIEVNHATPNPSPSSTLVSAASSKSLSISAILNKDKDISALLFDEGPSSIDRSSDASTSIVLPEPTTHPDDWLLAQSLDAVSPRRTPADVFKQSEDSTADGLDDFLADMLGACAMSTARAHRPADAGITRSLSMLVDSFTSSRHTSGARARRLRQPENENEIQKTGGREPDLDRSIIDPAHEWADECVPVAALSGDGKVVPLQQVQHSRNAAPFSPRNASRISTRMPRSTSLSVTSLRKRTSASPRLGSAQLKPTPLARRKPSNTSSVPTSTQHGRAPAARAVSSGATPRVGVSIAGPSSAPGQGLAPKPLAMRRSSTVPGRSASFSRSRDANTSVKEPEPAPPCPRSLKRSATTRIPTNVEAPAGEHDAPGGFSFGFGAVTRVAGALAWSASMIAGKAATGGWKP